MKSKKNPIAILVNDLHLNKDNGELVKNIFHQALLLADGIGVDYIFIGGDVFTNRSGQPLSCLIDLSNMIESAKKMDKKVIAIPGNHDKTDASDESSYLDIFDCENFEVVSRFRLISFDKCVVGFIPYFNDERWIHEFNLLNRYKRDILSGDVIDKQSFLITHMGMDGVMNNDGTIVTSEIKSDMFFGSWNKVLVGHYHNASKVGKNIYYTGSAYQGNFGETIEDKGFTIMYDDGSIESVQSTFPHYIKYVVDVNDSESLMDIINGYKDNKVDNIRIVFRGSRTDLQKINVSEMNGYGFDCKFEANEKIEAMSESNMNIVMSYDKKSIMSDFLNFCKENDIKGDMKAYGIKLLKLI